MRRGRLLPALGLAIALACPSMAQDVPATPPPASPATQASPPVAAPADRGGDDERPPLPPADSNAPPPAPPPETGNATPPPSAEPPVASPSGTPPASVRPSAGQAAAPDAGAAPPAPSPAQPAPRPAPRPGDNPPEDGGAAPAADPAPPEPAPTPPAEGALSFPEPARSSGRLIPPEAYDEPVAPLTITAAAPAATPQPDLLRETDFDHAACRLGLTMLGVSYVEVDPVVEPDNRDCGIARPVQVTEIQPGITLEGSAVMRCETARALALWTREIVVPAAGRMPDAPALASMTTGSGYACRGVVGGASEERVSEHALGNAIDIAGFGFDDGSTLAISPAGDRGDLTVAFQNAVQGSACLYFATVLGPGSNAAHDDHLHLDVKARQSGFRLCQ